MRSVLSKLFFLGVLFPGLGTPLNGLPEFLIFSLAFFLIAFGVLRLERWRLLAAFMVIVMAAGLASVIRPPAIDEGFNVFLFKNDPGALSEGLPPDVFKTMAQEMKSVVAPYRCDQAQPGCWLHKTPRPDRLHAFSADGALEASDGFSRHVYDIGFKNRDQLFSAAINREDYYNFYGSDKNPERQFFPVFVSHRFPAAYEGSRLCWTGTLIRQASDGRYERFSAPDSEQCLALTGLAERPETLVYNFDPHRQFSMKLDRPWMVAIQDIVGRLVRMAAAALAVILLVDFRKRRQLLVPLLALGATLIWAAGWDLSNKASALLDGLTIYRGGTDGLTHDGMARDILFQAVSGNWIEALRGGESVFFYQPAFRYVLALGKFLFGETHYFYVLAIALVPVAVYRLLTLLFPPRWSMGLFLIFLLTPIFERMGFSHFNYIYQLHRGHAEPLGYGAFIAAMGLLLPADTRQGSKDLTPLSPVAALMGGLLLALAVTTRPNLALGAAVLAAGMGLVLLRQRNFLSIVSLAAGGAAVFLALVHNLVFGGKFVFLSNVSTNPTNLRMTPQAYSDAFAAMMRLDFASSPWMRMVSHLGEWNGLTDIYRLPLLAITLYVCLQRKFGTTIRIIAVMGITQQGMLLFYNASGRYAYLAWMLCFLTTAVYVREELLPLLQDRYGFRWTGGWKQVSSNMRLFSRRSPLAESQDSTRNS